LNELDEMETVAQLSLVAQTIRPVSVGSIRRPSRFVRIPVPEPYSVGSYSASSSADGTRLAFATSGSLNVVETGGAWLYDVKAHQLRVIRGGVAPLISGNGRFLYYYDFDAFVSTPDFWREDLTTGRRQSLRSQVDIPQFGVYKGIIDDAGERIAFLRYFSSATTANLFEFATDSTRRISLGPLPHEVTEVALSRDGQTAAFVSANALDPSVSTNGLLQVFIYDDRTQAIRQLTGRDDDGGAYAVRLSADGRTVSYMPTESAITVLEVPSGAVLYELDVGPDDLIGDYYLSGDSNVLAFTSTADLDPAVGNPEYWSQLFRFDRRTGRAEQITDVTSQVGYFETMDTAARMFFLGIGGDVEIDGMTVRLHAVRVVERREPNRRPSIGAPALVTGREGAELRVPLTAADPDSDPLTFFAELEAWSGGNSLVDLGGYLADVIDADRDGMTELILRPGFDQAGRHRLQVAVFDGGGGAAARLVELDIADVAFPQVDLNCDHRFDAADVNVVANWVFNTYYLGRQCLPSDANGDGVTTAADLTALLQLFRPENG
jgi:hypothetical protein